MTCLTIAGIIDRSYQNSIHLLWSPTFRRSIMLDIVGDSIRNDGFSGMIYSDTLQWFESPAQKRCDDEISHWTQCSRPLIFYSTIMDHFILYASIRWYDWISYRKYPVSTTMKIWLNYFAWHWRINPKWRTWLETALDLYSAKNHSTQIFLNKFNHMFQISWRVESHTTNG